MVKSVRISWIKFLIRFTFYWFCITNFPVQEKFIKQILNSISIFTVRENWNGNPSGKIFVVYCTFALTSICILYLFCFLFFKFDASVLYSKFLHKRTGRRMVFPQVQYVFFAHSRCSYVERNNRSVLVAWTCRNTDSCVIHTQIYLIRDSDYKYRPWL